MNRRALLIQLPVGPFFVERAFATGHTIFCAMAARGGAFLPSERIYVPAFKNEALLPEVRSVGRPVRVLAENRSDYLQAARNMQNGQLPPRSSIYFYSSYQPQMALNAIDSPVSRSTLLFNVPESVDEFVAIHGHDVVGRYTTSQLARVLERFASVAQAYRQIGGQKLYRSSDIINAVRASGPSGLVQIASHVERESFAEVDEPRGVLPLVNGDRFNVDDIPKNGALTWIVGCDTKDLSENLLRPGQAQLLRAGKIGYVEALATMNTINRVLRPDISLEGVIFELQKQPLKELMFDPDQSPVPSLRLEEFQGERPTAPHPQSPPPVTSGMIFVVEIVRERVLISDNFAVG